MSKYPEDDQLLSALAAGDEASWNTLYDDLRSPFRLYFIKTGYDPEKTIALFQEAMVILHKNIISGKLEAPLHSTLKTYLIGVGRILVMRSSKEHYSWETEIPDLGMEAEVERYHEQKAQASMVSKLLEQLGDPCKKLLELFYMQNYVMEAIAEAMNLPSAGAARRRKHDCLKRLRNLMP
jgi:RNA polymerase sigma factor (sigma-70 family)